MHFRNLVFLVKWTLAVSLGVVSGCASYRPNPPIPPDTLQKQFVSDVGSADLLSKYNAMPQSNAAEIAVKVTRRNQIIQELLWLIDQNYGKFEEGYYGSDASINFWGDALNLGLTGVSSVGGTAHVKSILSAIATGTTGAKTSYLKNFYDQQTRTAVVQQMRASRSTELAILQDANHMKASIVSANDAGGSAVAPYSLEQGISDTDSYYNAGTIIGALQAIATAAGTAQQKAKADQTTNSGAQQLY